MGAGPATVVATSAAIKWITKDGLGAAGRLIVGGRLASGAAPAAVAPACHSEQSSEACCTPHLVPHHCARCARCAYCVQCLTRTRGAGPAATNNVGDVAAKEEVWEVAAQVCAACTLAGWHCWHCCPRASSFLAAAPFYPHASLHRIVVGSFVCLCVRLQMAGLASSVALLQLVEGMGRPEAVVPAWLAVHSMHVGLRYLALSALRFPYPNQVSAPQASAAAGAPAGGAFGCRLVPLSAVLLCAGTWL